MLVAREPTSTRGATMADSAMDSQGIPFKVHVADDRMAVLFDGSVTEDLLDAVFKRVMSEFEKQGLSKRADAGLVEEIGRASCRERV